MTRILGATAWCCSLLAVVCLVLGVVAAPIGMAKADEPVEYPIFNCGSPVGQPNRLQNPTDSDCSCPTGNCQMSATSNAQCLAKLVDQGPDFQPANSRYYCTCNCPAVQGQG